MARIPKPSKLGMFQLLVASLLVALFLSPGEAHHGPMLIFKGGSGHHGGGSGGAAMILAAGILIKLFSQMGKHGHSSGGHSMGHHGYPMGGNGMGYSFESHDAHLQDYGYEPQEYVWPQTH